MGFDKLDFLALEAVISTVTEQSSLLKNHYVKATDNMKKYFSGSAQPKNR